MGILRKKGKYGAAATYINRNQAIKKLQLKLPDFRRLCILKGIYPVEPKHKKRLSRDNSTSKTYYLRKDIQHLLHEPLLSKFRDLKAFSKRLKKILAKGKISTARHFQLQKPTYSLDHIVRERYPVFTDALRDLDDALSMIFLFAQLPSQKDELANSAFKPVAKSTITISEECQRISREFMHYVIVTRSLKKCFVSIKGIYYQVLINGVVITWIVPHQFTQQIPDGIDLKVMQTFLEFYITLMGFVNYHLFTQNEIVYPLINPHFDATFTGKNASDDLAKNAGIVETSAGSVNNNSQQLHENTQTTFIQKDANQHNFDNGSNNFSSDQNLFSGKVFFLSREVPRETLQFLICSFGGIVGWENDDTSSDSACSIAHTSPLINFEIVDRPSLPSIQFGRAYIQPQWVFDCVNAGKLLDVEPYRMGNIDLPPHLSPFVVDDEDIDDDEISEEIDNSSVPRNKDSDENITNVKIYSSQLPNQKNTKDSTIQQDRENMAVSMMTKKQRKLYQHLQKAKEQKHAEREFLKAKRSAIASTK